MLLFRRVSDIVALDTRDSNLDKVWPPSYGWHFALVGDSVDQPADRSRYCSRRLFHQEVVVVAALERQHNGRLARPLHVVTKEQAGLRQAVVVDVHWLLEDQGGQEHLLVRGPLLVLLLDLQLLEQLLVVVVLAGELLTYLGFVVLALMVEKLPHRVHSRTLAFMDGHARVKAVAVACNYLPSNTALAKLIGPRPLQQLGAVPPKVENLVAGLLGDLEEHMRRL